MGTLAGFHASLVLGRFAAGLLALGAIVSGVACNDSGTQPGGSATGAAAAVSSASNGAATDPATTGGFQIVDAPNPALPWDYDLGVVPFGETAQCTVRLKNTEGRPLAVRELQAGCSCTSATIAYVAADGTRVEGEKDGEPMLVVPPDTVAELVVVSDTRLVPVQNATKRVRLVLTTDSATNPFLAIEVHLVVQLSFLAVPGTLRLGDVAESEGARGSAKIVGLDVDGRKLIGVERASPGVLATVRWDEGVVPDQWTLDVELAAPVERGPIDRFVELSTTGPHGEGNGPVVRVPIVGTGVPDFEIRPERLVFVGLDEGTTSEVEILGHLAGQRFRVLAIKPDAAAEGLIVADAEPATPDDSGKSPRWRLRARLSSRAQGELAGTLIVETDDQGEVAIPYAIAAKR